MFIPFRTSSLDFLNMCPLSWSVKKDAQHAHLAEVIEAKLTIPTTAL